MTDYEIDALYKSGIPVSHAAGLWAVYARGLEDALATMTACTCGSTVAPVTVTADEPVANDPVVLPDPPLAA